MADRPSAADWPLRLGGGLVGLVVGQLHALSRFATAEGVEDLALPATAAWAVPATEALSPLLGWGDADLVYVTYGKIWFPLFLAFTLCAFMIYKQRRPGLWEPGSGGWR